jgi:hypothetical protein
MRTIKILFFLVFLYHNSNAQTPGLSVKPVRLFYTLLNGQSSVQTVYIVNNTDKAQQFKLYTEDWTRDSTGGHIYLSPGSFPQSCARWVSFNKQFLELKPGESTDLLVKLQVPDSAAALSEMKWTMLFIETTSEKIAPDKKLGITTQVNNITRIGVHIVQTPPTLTEKDLKMISFSKVDGPENKFRITCRNTGKVQFDCKSYIELSSVATGEKTTVNKNTFPLFPNQVRYAEFVVPATLPKGKYTVVGVLDGGDDLPLQASELTIDIK